MEGHPPSMAAFVLQMIPLTNALEEVLTGILVKGVQDKVKGFADDVKVFWKDVKELDMCYEVIKGFELRKCPGWRCIEIQEERNVRLCHLEFTKRT